MSSVTNRPTASAPGLQHGVYSPATVNPVAQQLVQEVLERRPDLARYPEAVAAWGDLEAKARLLRAWVDEHGFFGNGFRPRAGVGLLLKFEEAARRARNELGLNPAAEVQLVKLQKETVAVDASLEDLKTRGREARNR
jgi:hypothetical protein